ncbi:hypothetical protein [Amycolatopsis methanolica]|uniref:hypothetical protein n=1 Tax=Amycolatopsis methanolica TaxID=1814 RepID=UPI000374C402|nr:hypothetical protein [Amycolatopsis methanolica]
MKVVCSFSLLLRIAFWLTVLAVVLGVSLGHRPAAAPVSHPVSVVGEAGEEVPQCRPTPSN